MAIQYLHLFRYSLLADRMALEHKDFRTLFKVFDDHEVSEPEDWLFPQPQPLHPIPQLGQRPAQLFGGAALVPAVVLQPVF